MIKEKKLLKKAIIILLLIVTAILSITVISDYASSTETHANSIKVLDDKKMTAMSLTTGVAVTSTAISAIPNDTGSPIAEQISQLTGPLLVVVCIIYLEKFLLTITGYISFTYLIPIACGLFAGYVLTQKEMLKMLAIKLSVFAVAIFLIVPTSVKVTNLVEATFQESISQTFESAQEIGSESQEADEDSNKLWKFIESVGDSVSNVVETAKNALSTFVDAVAVLIITTCVIPVVVLLMFVWIIKIIFGLNINTKNIVGKISEKKDHKKIGFIKNDA